MKTIQQIFDAVIDAGHYPCNGETFPSSNFMCNALDFAHGLDVITAYEQHKASVAINTYMDKLKESAVLNPALYNVVTLRGALNEAHVKTRKSNLAIYKDWKNRPHVRKVK